MRNLTLVILLGIATSCAQGSETTRDPASSSSQSGASGERATGGDDTPTNEELESADIPAEVSGSFLVCTPTGGADDTELNDFFGCGLRDTENKKIEGEGVRLGLEISRVIAGTLVPVTDLARDTEDTPWHVIFKIAADDVEVTEKLEASLVVEGDSLTWENDAFTEDDPDILAELDTYRSDMAKALEAIDDLLNNQP